MAAESTWLEPLLVTYQQFTKTVLAYLPTLIAAMIVFIVGVVIAWGLKRVVIKISRAANALLRRFTRHGGDALARLPWPLATIIGNLVFWLAVVFFLAVCAHILGLPGLAAWVGAVVGALPRILVALIIVFAGYNFAVLARDAISRFGTHENTHGRSLLARTAFALINLIAVLVAMEQLGIDVSLLQSMILLITAAALGGIAFAFGLGARHSVDNIIAGYYVRKTYSAGERVKIGELEGVILELTPAAVVVDARDGRALIPARLFQRDVSILLDEEDGAP